MRNISLTISKVSITNEGNYSFVTGACKENAKGSWVLSPKQATALLATVGLTLATKYMAVGGQLTIPGQDVKAGDTWTNEQSGETGIYTKDHFRNQISDMSLELNQEKSLENSIAQAVAQGLLAKFGATPATKAPAQSLSSIPATAIAEDVRVGESITTEETATA